jgi:hypothetical protein
MVKTLLLGGRSVARLLPSPRPDPTKSVAFSEFNTCARPAAQQQGGKGLTGNGPLRMPGCIACDSRWTRTSARYWLAAPSACVAAQEVYVPTSMALLPCV